MTRSEGRRFGLVVGGAFLALGAISHWRGHPFASIVLWSIGGALVAGGLLIPTLMGPVHGAWMRLALALSRITSPIFMGLVYFGVFTPMGMVRRLLGHNALVRPRGESFWIPRAQDGGRRSDLKRQF